jgi:outer membrane protein
MKKLTLALSLIVALQLLAAARDARADEFPPNTIRLGMYAIFYHVNAQDLSGPYVPAGVGLQVPNVQTLYLAYLRQLSPHFEFELAFGWPPATKTEGKGPATLGSVPYNGVVISSARWLAPTALIHYEFLDESSVLRPYVGVGINYTTFYDRRSTAAGNEASGGPTQISLSPSWGPAANVGLNYRLSGAWSAMASYSFTRVDTRLSADTDGVERGTHIRFGPQALVVAVGYSF